MYRSDKANGYGGTILYVRNNLEHRSCRPLNTQDYDNSAWCWIVEKGGKKILVGSVYRSPNSTLENDKLLLEKLKLAQEVAGDNRVLILGDFNVPRVDWANRNTLQGANRIERSMLEVAEDCFLFQHVKEDTRFRNDQSSLLDLTFTKEEEDIRNIQIMSPLGNSDHGVVTCEFVSEWKQKIIRRKRRMYHKGNYEKINEELLNLNWADLFQEKNVHECWEIFKGELDKLIDIYVPLAIPKDYNEPWMNGSLLRLWKKKRGSWERYTNRKGHYRYQEYKNDTKKFKKELRKAKRIYEKKLAKEARYNRRAFFKYVNSRLTVRPEITEMQNEDGTLVDNDVDICNILGKYFNSVHTPPSSDDMPPMNENFINEIRNLYITEEKGHMQKK